MDSKQHAKDDLALGIDPENLITIRFHVNNY